MLDDIGDNWHDDVIEAGKNTICEGNYYRSGGAKADFLYINKEKSGYRYNIPPENQLLVRSGVNRCHS